MFLTGYNDGTTSTTSLAVHEFLALEEATAPAGSGLKAALGWFVGFVERLHAARTLHAELAFYAAGLPGNSHRDGETARIKNQFDHQALGGGPKGMIKAGPIELRLAWTIAGGRSMSFRGAGGGVVATIARGPGRGVAFAHGAHTAERGSVEHQNNAGPAPGVTMILTQRAAPTKAFKSLSPAERLFAHAGLAVYQG